MFENGDLWKMVKEQQIRDWVVEADHARRIREVLPDRNRRPLQQRALARVGEYLAATGNRLQERYGDCSSRINAQSQRCSEQAA
jgi:hypothetical protein